MGKKNWREAWLKEFNQCGWTLPPEQLDLSQVVKQLTSMLYALEPGEYQIRVSVTEPGRYSLPHKNVR
jgi:hypothetical protein